MVEEDKHQEISHLEGLGEQQVTRIKEDMQDVMCRFTTNLKVSHEEIKQEDDR